MSGRDVTGRRADVSPGLTVSGTNRLWTRWSAAHSDGDQPVARSGEATERHDRTRWGPSRSLEVLLDVSPDSPARSSSPEVPPGRYSVSPGRGPVAHFSPPGAR